MSRMQLANGKCHRANLDALALGDPARQFTLEAKCGGRMGCQDTVGKPHWHAPTPALPPESRCQGSVDERSQRSLLLSCRIMSQPESTPLPSGLRFLSDLYLRRCRHVLQRSYLLRAAIKAYLVPRRCPNRLGLAYRPVAQCLRQAMQKRLALARTVFGHIGDGNKAFGQ